MSLRNREKKLSAALASITMVSLFAADARAAFSVMDKDIPQIETAYESGADTVTDVVNQYLARIATYNKASYGTAPDGPQFQGTLGEYGNGINAIAQVNPNAVAEAEADDAALAAGTVNLAAEPLFGIPVIIKNSYDVAGLITTNGVSVLNGTAGTSPETTDIPTTNAFAVQQLINAGAIILGKANMSTMAYSFDGIDNAGGVVQNPYQPLRQPGGSSSGIGAGVAATFAEFGMGGETGGSIRVPSNADDDCGLKTSAGLIDPGGTWPLTPTRDVVGPIARDVTDIAYAMNALVGTSATDIWDDTPYYPSTGPQPGAVGTGTGETSTGLTTTTGTRPVDYTSFLSKTALQGKVIAVENDYVGIGPAYDGAIAPLEETQFQTALNVLREQGATVVYVNLPATVTYYNTIGATSSLVGHGATTSGFPYPYPTTTVGGTTPDSTTWSNYAAAYYYNQEIESEHDPNIKNLDDFAAALKAGAAGKAGSPYSTLSSANSNIASLDAVYDAGEAAGFATLNANGSLANPGAIEALQAFTDLRENQVDAFMDNPGIAGITHIDAFVAPTYGSIVPSIASSLLPKGVTAPSIPGSTASGGMLGRFFGNILGMPALSVPMGYYSDGTPMGIQFYGRLDSEGPLIGYAYDYEQATEWHADPNLSFVPEPSAFGLVTLGSLLLLRRRSRST
jgi:amidase